MHKAVLEGLTCGCTHIAATQLEATLTELSAHNLELGRSSLEEQFAQLEAMSPRPDDGRCRTALQYPHKNRTTDYLPSTFNVPIHIHQKSTSQLLVGRNV